MFASKILNEYPKETFEKMGIITAIINANYF
jgi:hypothetical protein